jgi:2C-methyl-D-erythritol 2,4-cyclodiphosphate synthase
MALLQAGLTQELQPLSLSITFGAWRQVAAFKPRLQQALKRFGFHFPDTAGEYKGIDSKILLKATVKLITERGYTIGNIDSTVCLQRPKINPFIPDMKLVLAEVMGISEEDISIKATTTEKLGYVGREEGVSAYAVVLIEKAITSPPCPSPSGEG